MPRLTDTAIRSLPVPVKGQRTYFDDSFPNFGCRVSQGGTRSFILQHGLERRLTTIGRYGIISLAEARVEAKRILAEKTLGKTRPQAITYPKAIDVFLTEKRAARRASTVHDLADRLSRHFAFTGQLSEISHRDIVRHLSKIKTPREHNHALRVAKTFFTWAVNRRYISENPTTGISTHRVHNRSRVLSDDEIALIWKATEKPTHFNHIVRLLLLTGQRRGEIAAIQSSWINENTITLPVEITKNGRLHTFPIGSLARKLVNPSAGLLFPAQGKPDRPFNGWSKRKAALDKACPIEPWTLHDLRRTFATNLAALGTPIHVTERLLNHISGATTGGIVAIYQRYNFWDEQVAAVNAWEKRITELLDARGES